MSEANVKFIFEGKDWIIQFKTNEKMKYICQKYSTKVKINLDSLLFLYGGNKINFALNFESQANSLDKANKEMTVIVYKLETDDFACPKCGEKIKIKREKIDETLSSIKEIKDTIKGVKLNIKNIIKSSKNDSTNYQLKNIKKMLSMAIEDIRINNENIKNLFNDFDNLLIKNKIKKQIPNLVDDIKKNTKIII